MTQTAANKKRTMRAIAATVLLAALSFSDVALAQVRPPASPPPAGASTTPPPATTPPPVQAPNTTPQTCTEQDARAGRCTLARLPRCPGDSRCPRPQ